MNRHSLFAIAILVAGLTALACGHTGRIELPEQVTRVERKTGPITPVIPAAHRPDPRDPESITPKVPLSHIRDTHDGRQEQRLVDGLTALSQGEIQAAVTLAEEILGDDPHDARAHCLLGMAYLQLDGTDRVPRPRFIDMAEDELLLTLTLVPDYPPALYHLAMIALRRGDVTAAEDYLLGLRATGRATAAAFTLERAIADGSPILVGGLK